MIETQQDEIKKFINYYYSSSPWGMFRRLCMYSLRKRFEPFSTTRIFTDSEQTENLIAALLNLHRFSPLRLFTGLRSFLNGPLMQARRNSAHHANPIELPGSGNPVNSSNNKTRLIRTLGPLTESVFENRNEALHSLSEEQLTILLTINSPYKRCEIAAAWRTLTGMGITDKCFHDIVPSLDSPFTQVNTLDRFVHKKELLSGPDKEENFREIITGKYNSLAYSLGNLLTTNNFKLLKNAVATLDKSMMANLTSVLYYLGYHPELLTEGNFIKLMALPIYTSTLSIIMGWMQDSALLTQDNFDLLINNYDSIHQHEGIMGRLEEYVELPDIRLTQGKLEQIIGYIINGNQIAFDTWFTSLLNRNDTAIEGNLDLHCAFNSQSTHTASIHNSVSIAASKLHIRYFEYINTDKKIQETFKNMEDVLDQNSHLLDGPSIQHAKTRLSRIKETAIGNYKDPTSKVTLKQFLMLGWYAIHDKENRKGELVDAYASFFTGLYEMEREYKLSPSGQELAVETSRDDHPEACPAGQFNKIAEKLWCIHSDVELVFISRATASLKLRSLVTTSAKAYLDALPNEKQQALKKALRLENDFSPIWSNIENTVSAELLEEFGSLYNNDSDHSDFLELLASYRYVPLPNWIEDDGDSKEDQTKVSSSGFYSRPQSRHEDYDEGVGESKIDSP